MMGIARGAASRITDGTRVLIILIAMFMALFLAFDYQRTVNEARRSLDHVAELFNQNFQSSLSIATLQVETLMEWFTEAKVFEPPVIETAYGDFLRASVEQVNQIDSLVIISDAGTVLWATTPRLIGLDLSDRDYFQRARDAKSKSYVLGVPIISRGTGREVTPIAWPWKAPDGTLLGVFASALGETYFHTLLSETTSDAEMIISIESKYGPIAFTSLAETEVAPNDLLTETAEIKRTQLETAVSMPRGAVIQGYALRATMFTLVTVVLFSIAIAAASTARGRAQALASSLQRADLETLRAQQAQAQFRAIFQNVDDGIVVFNRTGDFMTSNRRARELLQVTSDGAAIEKLCALVPGIDTMGETTEARTFAIALGEAGTGRDIRCRISKVDRVGQETLYCVLNDISAEERLVQTRAKFIETVNHELRTPLTSLIGSLEVALKRYGPNVDAKLRRLLELANQNGERLLMLVNDILTMQALDEGHLTITPTTLSCVKAQHDVAAAMQGYAESFGVSIKIDDPVRDSVIEADEGRLQQILSNLMSNAIKYAPRGSSVRLGCQISTAEVRFEIEDRGPGIPKEKQNEIFDRFAKPVHDIAVQASGTGLGLAITRELVIRQGGEIGLISQHVSEGEPTGTTFWVEFPIKSAAQQRGEDAA